MKRPSEHRLLETVGRPAGLRAWSKCEFHLLSLLTSGPFLLTKKQICRPSLRGPFSTTVMGKAVNQLKSEGWLESYTVETQMPRLFNQPFVVCQPHQVCPDFRRLKAKFQGQPGQSRTWKARRLYLPSRQTANLFGSPYYGVAVDETNDYRLAISHVASVVSAGAIRTPADWIWDTNRNLQPYERSLGIRLDTGNGPTRVAGIVRAQSCQMLKRLHAHCCQRGWPIELW